MVVRGARAMMARAGPGESFEAFYESQWGGVVAVVRALCRDAGIAEELTQEAFLKAYGRWGQISTLERPEFWVRRVALNLAVSRFRRLRAEVRALARMSNHNRDVSPVASAVEVAEFWDALRALPPRQAQVAALYYVDDLPIAQIAELLKCAEGTVKAHLHAARQRLRDLLDPDGGSRP